METAHTDKNFEQKLNHLTDNLIKMSNIVEKQIEIAVNVIKSKDSSDAQTTQNLDEQVDEVERDVRDLSFEIMTLHRPCLLYTSPSPRDSGQSRMPSSA